MWLVYFGCLCAGHDDVHSDVLAHNEHNIAGVLPIYGPPPILRIFVLLLPYYIFRSQVNMPTDFFVVVPLLLLIVAVTYVCMLLVVVVMLVGGRWSQVESQERICKTAHWKWQEGLIVTIRYLVGFSLALATFGVSSRVKYFISNQNNILIHTYI